MVEENKKTNKKFVRTLSKDEKFNPKGI